MATAEIVIEPRRTPWDIVLGVLLIIAGCAILAHAAVATLVSVWFIAWIALAAGVVELIGAVMRVGKAGFWSAALGGGLLTALGLIMLRNPDVAVVSLTLVAGSLFLVGGITRLVASFAEPAYRWPLLIGGVVSTGLGLIVLFNIFTASLVLLGLLVGVEALTEGLMLLIIGRFRVTDVTAGPGSASTFGGATGG